MRNSRHKYIIDSLVTCNIKILFQAGKLTYITRKMNRLNIDAPGLAEIRWPGTGICQQEKSSWYYTGAVNEHLKNGVEIVIKKEMQQSLLNFIPYNDRMMLLQIETHPIKNFLTQICPHNNWPWWRRDGIVLRGSRNLPKELRKHE